MEESQAGNFIGWRIIVSMQDPVADMLTRIRNAQSAKHPSITLAFSKFKEEIARVLKEEGYIVDYGIESTESGLKSLKIQLKYYKSKPVIERIIRISRPGLRVYQAAKELQAVPGFGIRILSTSSGVMSHLAAKQKGIGGEVICEIA